MVVSVTGKEIKENKYIHCSAHQYIGHIDTLTSIY